ncbi:efflux RND transporter periplasmic adaptor subunit [Novispirillum itersonii]|uniref:Multidrug efflux system membrane fusion protein n=1 Tax=Novispirillum itersonii TaxID=189 RepID=A0A7W9ZHX7_NOVIT|nr:efflux RND transporter periplasmic adaptor subunit [Novispirillum itersonii]MBB6210414.1 multidrug efflux system membrane fusion protein [Novispirillum itersonii]
MTDQFETKGSGRGLFSGRSVLLAGVVLTVLAGGASFLMLPPQQAAQASDGPAAPPAVPVQVAAVEHRSVVPWEDFSGRLEAVDRVEIRSRVSGQVLAVHFREGGLVKKGDLLVTIDPAPYQTAVDGAEAQLASAQSRLTYTKREYDRAKALSESGSIPTRDVDARANAFFEAQAAARSAQAALESAKLNLSYTRITAPVSGRVGRAEVTVGNLVPAGAGAPVLTTLVSVSPIYATFDASERTLLRSLTEVRDPATGTLQVDRIPVRMTVQGRGVTPVDGHVQMVGNSVDPRSGTVQVRAVFDNADGLLMPGQFARLSLGQPVPEQALLVSERAVGTDQDKKFVMVVGADNRAAYRPVVLGPVIDGLRMVTDGLKAGDQIIVSGLQRVRPGAVVAPQTVAMTEIR